MRRTLFLIGLFSVMSLILEAKTSIRIYLTDGTSVEYDTAEIDSLSMIEPVPTEVTDIEGRRYKVEMVGKYYWMFQDLVTACYDTLSPLRGRCLQQSTDSTCAPYTTAVSGGRLYNWSGAVAMNTAEEALRQTSPYRERRQGICPNKFHLPSRGEIEYLSAYMGGNAGSVALRKDNFTWAFNPFLFKKATNSSGFGAEGHGYAKGVEQKDRYLVTSYWSSDAVSETSAYTVLLSATGSTTLGSENKELGRSVRCVWDGQTDRDWLYVYKKNDPEHSVDRYKTEKITQIILFDDISNAYLNDTEGNWYRTKRYGITNWTLDNIRITAGHQYNTLTPLFSPYYTEQNACDGGDAVRYYSASAAMGMTKDEFLTMYNRQDLIRIDTQVKGICPDGWRLPLRADFDRLRPYIESREFEFSRTSGAYFNGKGFSQGAESMFWVSDFTAGYKETAEGRQYFLRGIPHIDYIDGYEGRMEYVETLGTMPALPCRCVQDLQEPFMDCHNRSGSVAADSYGIWSDNYPQIYFEEDGDGVNSMRVQVGGSGYYDTVTFR